MYDDFFFQQLMQIQIHCHKMLSILYRIIFPKKPELKRKTIDPNSLEPELKKNKITRDRFVDILQQKYRDNTLSESEAKAFELMTTLKTVIDTHASENEMCLHDSSDKDIQLRCTVNYTLEGHRCDLSKYNVRNIEQFNEIIHNFIKTENRHKHGPAAITKYFEAIKCYLETTDPRPDET